MAKDARKTQDELDREIMRGGLGSESEGDEGEGGEGEGEGSEEGQKPEKPAAKTLEERFADMERENAEMKGLLRGLSTPRETPKPAKKEPVKRDWEKMMFEDTEGAVATLKADLREEIIKEVRGDYEKDQGTKEFWKEFYEANDDLKGDKELVQAMLTANMGTLADLPVSEASKRLGDLTRERIMKYTGKVKKEPDTKSKARTEEAGERKPAAKKPEDNKVVSLGDLIKARRAVRVQARTKAQTA